MQHTQKNRFTNTYSIIVNGEEFTLAQNFNTDNNTDNVDVYAGDKFLGEIENITIPEIGFEDETISLQPSSIQEDEDVTAFEKRFEEWLTEYYSNN